MFLSVDGGCSRIFNSGTSQGPCRQRFLALKLGAPGSSTPAPPRASVVDIFYIDGGRSLITSSGTTQGACRQRFLR
jgi:hypothetical protein